MDQRILVIGTSGSGKTTFSSRLASVLSLQHVELDGLYWGHDWTPCDPTAFYHAVKLATALRGWIVDGNYVEVNDVVAGRATAIIWLNYPLPTVLRRFVLRALRRGLFRERLWNGNIECLRDTLLSRESLLRYILRTHAQRRRQFKQLRTDGAFPDAVWIEFRSPKEANAYLRQVEAMR